MAIIKTITNEYEFYEWIKQSDNYSNNFTLEGAKALQKYFEEYSEEVGEDLEFDPIAWCCEFSEYEDYDTFQSDTGGYGDINSLEDVKDHTTVIEFDGGIIVQDF